MNAQETADLSVIKESISVKHGHYFIFITVLFFQFINKFVRSHGPPKSLTEDEWKWRNLFVSWIHAIISSLGVVTCTLVCPELYSDLFLHINHLTFYCVCFSTGYFLYDLLDLIVNNKFFTLWEVSLHHIVVAGTCYYNLCNKSQMGYSIVALTVEINSVFLHWRKLLLMAKTPLDSPTYTVIKYLNLISFFIFRGGALLTISMGIYLYWSLLSPVYIIGTVTTMFFLDVLNIVLFWRLFKNDILRGRRGAGRKSTYITKKQENGDQNNCSNNHVITSNNNLPETVKSWTVNCH